MKINGQKGQQTFGMLNLGNVFSNGDRVWMKTDSFTAGKDRFNAVALDRYETVFFDSKDMITYHAKASVHLDE